ncbi:MAG: aconitate hydratase AcnA [Pseudomonadota bacterium]|nr:aconitate hydratase AcnA [Pseudomonadota bacterium]
MSLDPVSLNSFKSRKTLKVGKKTYTYYSLKAAEKNGLKGISKLPFSMKVLLENLLRFEDGRSVTKEDIMGFVTWLANKGKGDTEVGFRPARVLMQDFTGVPAVVDLAAMRDGMKTLKGSADKINPLVPVDLVIDHSVVVDYFGNKQALAANVKREYEQNMERYKFLKWGQGAFENFRVVPPGTGICHQVNLEYLSQTVWTKQEGKTTLAYPDTLVGTDSHTTMVNGLGVLGWGVGGIEAEAAMLGQPQSMLLPEVIGFKMTGKLREGVTATDLVLLVTQMLRKKGVVNKFVEFYGEGLKHLTLADRATIGNMAPEYGATCGFFPVDGVTIDYLEFSGRAKERIALVEKYCKAQGMFRSAKAEPMFTDTLSLDLSSVVPAMAGPNRPEKFAPLDTIKSGFLSALDAPKDKAGFNKSGEAKRRVKVEGKNFDIGHGDVLIAAITSCTNTSNPTVLIGAGLLAKKAAALGLQSKPWVKTSFAPGSQVVSEYMNKSGLQKELDKLGFYLVGYGCTTCIGNSGPLDPAISKAINDSGIIGAAVLSGNRNFEGRISPDVQAAYLASPPLVVAYALAGSTQIDLTTEPLGKDKKGKAVYLKDIWPTNKEIEKFVRKNITAKMFKSRYADVFKGDKNWRGVPVAEGETYNWDNKSTYVQNPPYFAGITPTPKAVTNVTSARVLGLFGDKITTDHISPAGAIKAASPAGKYLTDNGVAPLDFNQYGTRRGNHEVMMRGTFANIRIRNHMMGPNGREGGFTIHYPSKEEMPIYDAAMEYKNEGVPLVVFAGVEYGNGSSRDWAAKGTNLLGVRAVIAQSFERIHRSNLVGMGVVPLQFKDGDSWAKLGLKGDEKITIDGLAEGLRPRATMKVDVERADGSKFSFDVTCRIDTLDEIDYYKNGGILQLVLRNIAKAG